MSDPPRLGPVRFTGRRVYRRIARSAGPWRDVLVRAGTLAAGVEAGELLAVAVGHALNGGGLMSEVEAECGLAGRRARRARSRLREVGLRVSARRGPSRSITVEVRDDARLLRAFDALDADGVPGPRIPKDRVGSSGVSDTSCTRRAGQAPAGAEETGMAKGDRNRGQPRRIVRRRPDAEGSRANERPRPARTRSRTEGQEDRSRSAGQAAAPRRPVFGDREEMVRVLSDGAARGKGATRRRRLIDALATRFNAAYRRAWREAYGRRPASDRTRDFRDVAAWCAVEGIEPADFIEWATKEYAFTGKALAGPELLKSPKVRDRWVAARSRAKARAPRHAGMAYDYSLDVPDLRRRLEDAGLDGVDSLDEKDLARIERLAKHAVRDGRPPAASPRLTPFAEWAAREVYARTTRKGDRR